MSATKNVCAHCNRMIIRLMLASQIPVRTQPLQVRNGSATVIENLLSRSCHAENSRPPIPDDFGVSMALHARLRQLEHHILVTTELRTGS